jgi:hypothetical protein
MILGHQHIAEPAATITTSSVFLCIMQSAPTTFGRHHWIRNRITRALIPEPRSLFYMSDDRGMDVQEDSSGGTPHVAPEKRGFRCVSSLRLAYSVGGRPTRARVRTL